MSAESKIVSLQPVYFIREASGGSSKPLGASLEFL